MSVRMISEAVGISIGTVDNNSDRRSEAHKVCAKFVPNILFEEERH